jgi:hypothetical protein
MKLKLKHEKSSKKRGVHSDRISIHWVAGSLATVIFSGREAPWCAMIVDQTTNYTSQLQEACEPLFKSMASSKSGFLDFHWSTVSDDEEGVLSLS